VARTLTAPVKALYYEDDYIKDILLNIKKIVMVGASPNNSRPSNFAMKYLLNKGYDIIPVNPNHASKYIYGKLIYNHLRDIPYEYDMIDIFRPSCAVPKIIDDALELNIKSLSVIWMQLNIKNNEAASRAKDAGLKVIMDRCPKIEYARLFGELGWSGINTGILSAKKRKLL